MAELQTLLLTRTAALTALAAVAVFAILLIMAPALLAIWTEQDAIESARTELSARRGEAASLPQVKKQLMLARAQLKSFDGLIHVTNTSLAQAQMQSDFKTIIEDNLGTLRSAQSQPEENANGLDKVAVQFDATLPMSRLRDLIYAMETHRPYVVLVDVQIVGPATWDPAQPDPSLEVRWTARGFRSMSSP